MNLRTMNESRRRDAVRSGIGHTRVAGPPQRSRNSSTYRWIRRAKPLSNAGNILCGLSTLLQTPTDNLLLNCSLRRPLLRSAL